MQTRPDTRPEQFLKEWAESQEQEKEATDVPKGPEVEAPMDLSALNDEVYKTSTEVVSEGQHRLESVVESLGGSPEETKAAQTALAEIQEEMRKLTQDAQERIRQLTEGMLESETNSEARERIAEKARKVIEKIVEWAEREGIDISRVKKLGGGFVNLVLLIESSDGRGYVAKAFAESEEAETQKRAQIQLDGIAKEDEAFVPKVLEWIEDAEDEGPIVISEKAEGKSIRKILEVARDASPESPEALEEAKEAFYTLGTTLGRLHERTERPFDRDADTESAEYRLDAQKLLKHLSAHRESGLLDISDEQAGILAQNVDTITDGGFVSLVHGDAHLDQFFRAPDQSTLTIVDYDSLHEGDPMADVARSLSSLRDWGRKMHVPDTIVTEMEKSFIKGYRTMRAEGEHTEESEFSQVRILVYEARLNLVQLKHFDALREKLKAALPSDQTESDFYDAFENGKVDDLSSYNFDEREIEQLQELVAIRKNVTEILQYLQSLDLRKDDERAAA